MRKKSASGTYQSVASWSIGTTLIAALLLEVGRQGVKTQQADAFYRLVFDDDRIALWVATVLLGVALWGTSRIRPTLVERVLDAVDRHLVTLCIASFGLFGLAALFVYHRHPLSMDEFSIVYQSQVFAAGRLDGQVPPSLIDRLVAPIFVIEFFGVDRARGLITSVYWPGTSLLMTPFTLLGAPWLFNPCISSITIFCLHRATREVTNSPRTASWVTLLLLASPVIVINAASFYAMPAHMLASILYFWALFRAGKQSAGRNTRLVFIAGLVGGFALVLHNPIPHLCFALPWIAWIVTKRRDWIVPLLLGYLVFSLPIGVGWFLHLKTLDAQMPEMASSVLARLPRIFVLPSLTLITIRLLAIFKVIAWATPGMLVLCALAWRSAWNNLWLRLLMLSFFTLFFGYFFISYPQGHGWGYRFIHPAWFVLPLLAALALGRGAFSETLATGSEDEAIASFQTNSIRQFFALAMLLSFVVILPLRAWQVESFIRSDLAQIPTPSTGRREIVFINPSGGYYTADLVQNDPFLRNRVWKLRAVNPASDEKLARQFLQSPHLAQSGKWGELWVENEVSRASKLPERR